MVEPYGKPTRKRVVDELIAIGAVAVIVGLVSMIIFVFIAGPLPVDVHGVVTDATCRPDSWWSGGTSLISLNTSDGPKTFKAYETTCTELTHLVGREIVVRVQPQGYSGIEGGKVLSWRLP